MILQKLVLQAYTKFYRRVHTWILPGLIAINLFTVYLLSNPEMSSIARIYISKLHILVGLVIAAVGTIILYNFYLTWNNYSQRSTSLFKKISHVFADRYLWRFWVDFFFYLSLLLAVVSGVMIQYINNIVTLQQFREPARNSVPDAAYFEFLYQEASDQIMNSCLTSRMSSLKTPTAPK